MHSTLALAMPSESADLDAAITFRTGESVSQLSPESPRRQARFESQAIGGITVLTVEGSHADMALGQ